MVNGNIWALTSSRDILIFIEAPCHFDLVLTHYNLNPFKVLRHYSLNPLKVLRHYNLNPLKLKVLRHYNFIDYFPIPNQFEQFELFKTWSELIDGITKAHIKQTCISFFELTSVISTHIFEYLNLTSCILGFILSICHSKYLLIFIDILFRVCNIVLNMI